MVFVGNTAGDGCLVGNGGISLSVLSLKSIFVGVARDTIGIDIDLTRNGGDAFNHS